MKSFCIVALAFVAACAADDTYTSDAGLSIDVLVKDKKQVKEILDCFTAKSDCSPQAAALKDDLPDALGTACSKCTPQQKRGTRLFFEAVKKYYIADFEGLQKKFDPDNKLFPALEAAIASY
uniref:Chemosensory protein 17 n=1 Tax=Apocheima cinerarius TaxID=706528 RepID=A0A8T9EKT1_APOCI|nr:chemosensory protein 17 [Apocheima cinerarius]